MRGGRDARRALGDTRDHAVFHGGNLWIVALPGKVGQLAIGGVARPKGGGKGRLALHLHARRARQREVADGHDDANLYLPTHPAAVRSRRVDRDFTFTHGCNIAYGRITVITTRSITAYGNAPSKGLRSRQRSIGIIRNRFKVDAGLADADFQYAFKVLLALRRDDNIRLGSFFLRVIGAQIERVASDIGCGQCLHQRFIRQGGPGRKGDTVHPGLVLHAAPENGIAIALGRLGKRLRIFALAQLQAANQGHIPGFLVGAFIEIDDKFRRRGRFFRGRNVEVNILGSDFIFQRQKVQLIIGQARFARRQRNGYVGIRFAGKHPNRAVGQYVRQRPGKLRLVRAEGEHIGRGEIFGIEITALTVKGEDICRQRIAGLIGGTQHDLHHAGGIGGGIRAGADNVFIGEGGFFRRGDRARFALAGSVYAGPTCEYVIVSAGNGRQRQGRTAFHKCGLQKAFTGIAIVDFDIEQPQRFAGAHAFFVQCRVFGAEQAGLRGKFQLKRVWHSLRHGACLGNSARFGHGTCLRHSACLGYGARLRYGACFRHSARFGHSARFRHGACFRHNACLGCDARFRRRACRRGTGFARFCTGRGRLRLRWRDAAGRSRLRRIKRRRFHMDDGLALRHCRQRGQQHQQCERKTHDPLKAFHQRFPPILPLVFSGYI